MIGSGAIESGCKQIVTKRLKLSGAQRHIEGAVHTAKARAACSVGSGNLFAENKLNSPSLSENF